MRVLGEREIHRAAWRLAAGNHFVRARRLGTRRPELVAYVVAVSQGYSEAARAVAWQGLELACEALDAGRGEPRATIEQVLACHDRNLELALSVGEAHPRFAERYLTCSGRLQQRPLLRRFSDMAARDVPAGERGAVFLILKTLVDVLDQRPADDPSPGGAPAPALGPTSHGL